MAKVEIVEYREQLAHFGFYKQGAGGDVQLLIRRKVGDPTDYMHNHSKAVQRQREIFSQASIHYSHLTPTQKADWRRQIRWVPRIRPGSQSEEVILKGRQLFIAEDIHELATKQKQIKLPLEICIVLADQDFNPLEGELWLYCTVAGEWFDLPKGELQKGYWLFTKVPPGYPPYRVYGEAAGYFDPQLPEHQTFTEKELKAHHYHILHPEVLWKVFYQDVHYKRSWHTWSPDSLVTLLQIKHDLYTHAYEGELWLGVSNYGDEAYPERWVKKYTHHISASDPDPKHYEHNFSGLSFPPGSKFSYITWLPDWTWFIYWQGTCYYRFT